MVVNISLTFSRNLEGCSELLTRVERISDLIRVERVGQSSETGVGWRCMASVVVKTMRDAAVVLDAMASGAAESGLFVEECTAELIGEPAHQINDSPRAAPMPFASKTDDPNRDPNQTAGVPE